MHKKILSIILSVSMVLSLTEPAMVTASEKSVVVDVEESESEPEVSSTVVETESESKTDDIITEAFKDADEESDSEQKESNAIEEIESEASGDAEETESEETKSVVETETESSADNTTASKDDMEESQLESEVSGDDVETETPVETETIVTDEEEAVKAETTNGFTINENGVLTGYSGNEEHISIPDTVTQIGESAFEGNTTIKSVYIPNTVVSLGWKCFLGCTYLEKVEFEGGGSEKLVFSYKNESGINRRSRTFQGCTALKEIVLPGRLELIDILAFSGCTSLESVTFENGIKTISNNAFENCQSLKEVNIPGSVETIGSSAFIGCSSLEKVELNEGLLSIGASAFEGIPFGNVNKKGSLNIPASVTLIGYSAFRGCEYLETLTFEDGGTETLEFGYHNESGIHHRARNFEGCTSLKTIIFPGRLKYIEVLAFNGCTALENITFNEGIEELGGNSFSGCTSLRSMVIPDSMVTLGTSSFSGCSRLRQISLGKGLKTIGTAAFANCINLEPVVFNDGLETIGNEAFAGACFGIKVGEGEFNNGSIVIPNSVTAIGYRAFQGCLYLESVEFEPGEDKELVFGYDNENDLYRRARTFENCKVLKTVRFTNRIKVIDVLAFNGCTALETVIFSEGLETIKGSAFAGCTSLDYVKLPGTLKSIEESVFAGCTSLENIIFNQGLQSIGSYAFQSVPFGNELNYGKITIPKTVNSVGNSAFDSCKYLKSIVFEPDGEDTLTFPTKIESTIYHRARTFANCENLESIVFPKRVENLSSFTVINCPKLERLVIYQFTSFSEGRWEERVISSCPNVTIYGISGSPAEEYANSRNIPFKPISDTVNTKNNRDYAVYVYDEETKKPVSGVTVTVANKSYKTNACGYVRVSGIGLENETVYFTKAGYDKSNAKLSTFDSSLVKAYIKKNEQYKLAFPTMKQKVELSDTVTLKKKKIKWLNYACEMEVAFENEKFKVPVKVAYDDKDGTLEFALGISTGEEEDPEDKLDDTLFYYQAKNLVQDLASGKLKGMDREAIAKRHGLSLENRMKWGGVEVEPLLCGYIKVDVAANKIVEGGVVASLEAEGEVKWYPAVTGGLCYIKGTFGVGGSLKFAIALKDGVFEFNTDVEITQGVGVSGNIGTDNNHLGIGVDGQLKEEFPLPYKKEEFKLTGELTVYAEGVFFGETVHRSDWKIDKQLYPKVEEAVDGEHGHFSVDEDILSDMEYELVPRDYLTDVSAMDNSSDDEIPVYPYGAPKMCRLSDGTVIEVWLNDDGTKDAANRTTLVYSVCKNGEWSEPLAVAETGRADYYPSLVAQGNKAYLIWTNIGKEMTEETGLEEETKNTDIYFAEYSDGVFSAPQLVSLSDNKKLETEAMVAVSDNKQTVIWVENTENNVMLCTGKNTVVARTLAEGEWQDAVCIANDINAIYSVTAGYVNGVLYVVYAADSDGNIETVDDVDLYLYHEGYTEKITNDKKTNRCVQILGDRLYWLADGSLMQMPLTDVTAVSSLGIENIDNFKMLSNSNGGRAVVFSVNNGFYGELHMSKEGRNGFEAPAPITDYGNKVSDYAAVYMEDGSLMTMIFETKVDSGEDDDLSYGDTYIRNNATTVASNLQVTGSYLCVRDVVAGETIPVDISLYNGASQALTGVNVLFTGNGISQSEEVACNIAGGEKGYITVNWTVPDPIIAQSVKIDVMPVNYTDSNTSDNNVVQQIGGGDASVKSAEIAFDSTKNKNVINVTVENSGNKQLNNVTFGLLKDGQYGEQIYTESFALAAGAEHKVAFEVPDNYLEFENAFDPKYFYVVCESEEEFRTDNNTSIVVAYPVKVTGIENLDSTKSITLKESTKLNANVVPSNAQNQDVYYISENTAIATVLEDGTVIATGVGKTVITALSADGGYSAECVVTVTQGEETRYIDEKEISLMSGNTRQLSVLNELFESVEDEVTWTSSDENVATVDENGMVTAVAKGNAIIVANIGDTFTDTCIVEVYDGEIQNISISEHDLKLTEGETKQLTAYLLPVTHTMDKNVTWTSDDTSIVTVDESGLVTAVSDGMTAIKAVSSNGKTDICYVEVTALEKFSVTFDADTGDEAIIVSGILSGEKISLFQPVSRRGYTFEGWYTERAGKGQKFTEETAVVADITVYGFWKIVPTVIDTEKTLWTINKSSVELDKDETVSLAVNDKDGNPVRDIVIWTSSNENVATVDSNGIVTAVSAGESYIIGTVGGNFTLSCYVVVLGEIAEPEAKLCTVTFDSQGGSEVSAIFDVERGTTIKLPVAPTKEKCIFGGWFTETDGQGTELTEETIIDGNITVYAFWIYDGLWIGEIAPQTYTGKAIKPSVVVYDGEKLLKQGKDYTISYKNNIKANDASDERKAPTITVKGKGNYTGKETAVFKIEPIDLNSADVFVQNIFVNANDEEQFVVPELKWKGKKLSKKKDFTVSYPSSEDGAYRKPGTYIVSITGKGNFTGTKDIELVISDKILISNAVVEALQDVNYTGNEITPVPKVTYNESELRLNEDFELLYTNNKEIGTATVIIKGIGSYFGEMQVTFNILGGSIATARIEGFDNNKTYSGKVLKQNCTLFINDTELKEGTDYSVSYSNSCINKGKVTVTYTGINCYTGVLKKTYNITSFDIANNPGNLFQAEKNIEVPFAKGGSKPKPVVTFAGKVLTEGTDYSLSYKNTTAMGTGKVPTVIISGKGNFKGKNEVTYSIVKQDIGVLTLLADDKTFVQKENVWKTKISVVDLDGKKLKAGKDYDKNIVYTYKNDTELMDGTVRKAGETLQQQDILPADTIVCVTTKAIGNNYFGEITGEYRISKASITKAKVKIAAQTYTGSEIKPGYDQISVKVNGVELTKDDYIITGYNNNIQKGKATVTIRGIGQYGGTKTTKFTIKSKGFFWWWR